MKEVFYENLELYRKRFPREAVLLTMCEGGKYRLINDDGKINIQDSEGKFLHGKDPEKEAREIFKNAHLKTCDIIFFFGLGLGAIFEEAKPWLDENEERKLIIFEPSLEVIHLFFETGRAKKFLEHPQVSLYYLEEITEKQLRKWYWGWMNKQFILLTLPYWEEKEIFEHFGALLSKEIYQLNGTVVEFLNKGLVFSRNFYFNLPYLTASYYANGLFSRFKGLPAIITGAGASLEKAIPYLKSWGDKALILAGGSSMKALVSQGAIPHLGMGVDPNISQLDRFSSPDLREIPFLYSCRFYHPALTVLQAPLLYFSTETGYEIEKLYEKRLRIPKRPNIDGGYNVVNTAIELAIRFGCNPIILVGLDLAFTDDKIYSKGILNDIALNEDMYAEPVIERKDIYGKPVKTLWKWIKEAEWISGLREKFKRAKIYNATEGGIGMHGIPNISLEDVDKKILKERFLVSEWLHAEMQSMPLEADMEKIGKINKELEKNLKKTIKHLEVLLEEVENKHSGIAAFSEMEVTDEIAYRYVLDSFSRLKSFLAQKVAEEKNIHNLPYEEKEKLLIDVNREKIQFLKEVAEVNLDILLLSQKEGKIPKGAVSWKRFALEENLPAAFSDGIHEFNSADGKLLARVIIKDGKRQESSLFYPNGQIYVVWHYVDGKRRGEERYYDTDGSLRTSLVRS